MVTDTPKIILEMKKYIASNMEVLAQPGQLHIPLEMLQYIGIYPDTTLFRVKGRETLHDRDQDREQEDEEQKMEETVGEDLVSGPQSNMQFAFNDEDLSVPDLDGTMPQSEQLEFVSVGTKIQSANKRYKQRPEEEQYDDLETPISTPDLQAASKGQLIPMMKAEVGSQDMDDLKGAERGNESVNADDHGDGDGDEDGGYQADIGGDEDQSDELREDPDEDEEPMPDGNPTRCNYFSTTPDETVGALSEADDEKSEVVGTDENGQDIAVNVESTENVERTDIVEVVGAQNEKEIQRQDHGSEDSEHENAETQADAVGVDDYGADAKGTEIGTNEGAVCENEADAH